MVHNLSGGNRRPLPGAAHPAVIAAWAAVVAAGHIFPSIPMLGTGSNFSLSAALSPLSGIFFGPAAGALCSAAGGFAGSLIAPHTAWMGPFTFIIGTTTAFTSGCIAWGKWPLASISRNGNVSINGAIIVYIIGTALWFSQETGRSVVLFPLVYYGAGFAALIAGAVLARTLLLHRNSAFKFPAVWLASFGGMIGGATVGNFFSLILYKLPRQTWLYLTVAAPIERCVFSAGAMFIGVPLLIALPKIGVMAGPRHDEAAPVPPA